jgi:hypothetical protein
MSTKSISGPGQEAENLQDRNQCQVHFLLLIICISLTLEVDTLYTFSELEPSEMFHIFFGSS